MGSRDRDEGANHRVTRSRLRRGDLVRISPGIRETYDRGLKIRGGWPGALMWADDDRDTLAGSEFLHVAWESTGIVLGAAGGDSGLRLVRIMFPEGVGCWWPDHFERCEVP
jgi:hypothetical protein